MDSSPEYFLILLLNAELRRKGSVLSEGGIQIDVSLAMYGVLITVWAA